MWGLLVFGVCCGASFHAAVVDYGTRLPRQTPNMTAQEALAEMHPNLDGYVKCIAAAAAQRRPEDLGVLVVFPEDGLTGPAFPTRAAIAPFLEVVLEPGQTPGAEESPALAVLSAAARKYGAHVVAVLGERSGMRQYNTAVALGPDGAVAARYRKQHLYYEPQFDAGPPEQPQRFFETPFGRVGLAVCFDVLFADSLAALGRAAVVAAPSWWVNVPPLLPGIAMHSAVGRVLGRPLLAPSSGRSWFNSGSAIVSPDGTVLKSAFNPTSTAQTQMIQSSGFKRQRRGVPAVAPVVATPLGEGTVGDASCNATFRFSATVEAGERYSLIAFVGDYAPQPATPLFRLSLCAFVRCSLPTPDCVSLYDGVPNVTAVSVFESLELHKPDIFSGASVVRLSWVTDGDTDYRVLQVGENTTLTSVVEWETMPVE
jgi:predicted amidohydrolase